MKIKHISINNYLGIEELDISLDKDKVFIEGGNGKGKTSVLEAIENAMNSVSDRRPKKVKDGEEQAILLLQLDDGTEIKRVIAQDGSNKVEVKKDGLKVKGPETFLKNLFSGFTFNPVDFLQKKDKEQAEILLNMIPFFISQDLALEWFGEIPGVDYSQHGLKVLQELAEKYFFNKRAVANAEVKELNNQIEALTVQLPDNFDYKEWENVSLSEAYKEIEEKRAINNKIDIANKFIEEYPEKKEAIKNKFLAQINLQKDSERYELSKIDEVIQDEIKRKQGYIASHNEEIAALEEKIKEHKLYIDKLNNEINVFNSTYRDNEEKAIKVKFDEKIKGIQELENKELSDLETTYTNASTFAISSSKQDIETAIQEVETAEKMKGFIPLDQNRELAKKTLDNKKKVALHYDNMVNFCRNKPQEIIASMELPVEGLGIDSDGNITVHNRPIKNLSTAEQLDLAIDIARATAGELKIICIDKFESLDYEAQERFMEKTKDDQFTYVVTKVTGGDLKIK